MEFGESILLLARSFTFISTLLCGLLLFLRRRDGDRSRRILAWIFGLCALTALIRSALDLQNGFTIPVEVLPTMNLKAGLLCILLFLLYPIEVIRPGWLDFKRTIVVLFPWLLLQILFACIPDFRPLDSFHQIVRYAGEFNVWIRLVPLVLFLPITLVLLYIPHSWTKSSADNRWIRWFTLGSQIITVLYVLSILTGLAYVKAIHISYFSFFCLVVTYQEIFLRLRVPVDVQAEKLPQVAPVPAEKPAAPSCPPEANPLWNALMRLMDGEELWRNPDLTLEMLAARLDSNRTTLAQTIRQHGYEDYRHFINRRRIEEFQKAVRTDPRISIQDTFFRVGFRSKITALRYFRELTGTTPSDYLLRLPKRQ